MKELIRYDKYCVCYDYGVPQAICQRFESNELGGFRWVRERSCQYGDLTIGVVSAIMSENVNMVGSSVMW